MSPPAPEYTIAFTTDAKHDVAALDAGIRKRLKKVLQRKLAVNPSGYGSPLGGELAGYWKHEFAAHRIIHRLYGDRKLVVVCVVGKRQGKYVSDVYEQLLPMVKAGRVVERVLAILARLKSKP